MNQKCTIVQSFYHGVQILIVPMKGYAFSHSPCSSVSCLICFFLTNICAALCVPVPMLTFVMIDACWKIKPHNSICWTMLFGWLLCAECLQSAAAVIGFIRTYCRSCQCYYKKTTSKMPNIFFVWLNVCFPICLYSKIFYKYS